MLRRAFAIAVGCGLCLSSTTALADATVAVRGVASKAFQPDTVRVKWRIHASGKTARSVLNKLDANRAQLTKRVSGLDAPSLACRMGDAVAHDVKAETGMARLQAQAMAMAMGGGGEDEKKDTRIRMAFLVVLEWKLSGQTLSERQRAMDDIREQLRELGVMDAASSDDDDDEDDDEDEDEDEDEEGEEKSPARLRVTDGPTFFYVRSLNPDEADAVARAAFQDAERRAARLAKAAGRSLGPLIRVSDSPENPRMEDMMSQSTQMMQQMFGENRPEFDDEVDRPESELVSPNLKPILYKVTLSASFKLN